MICICALVQGILGASKGEEAWQVAPAGSVPNMDVAAAQGSTAVTMIPQMDATLLEVTSWHDFTNQATAVPCPDRPAEHLWLLACVQAYLGVGHLPEHGASPWLMGDDLGAHEDDGSFMEASPIDRGPPGDDEDVGNTYTAGQESLMGVFSHFHLICYQNMHDVIGTIASCCYPWRSSDQMPWTLLCVKCIVLKQGMQAAAMHRRRLEQPLRGTRTQPSTAVTRMTTPSPMPPSPPPPQMQGPSSRCTWGP